MCQMLDYLWLTKRVKYIFWAVVTAAVVATKVFWLVPILLSIERLTLAASTVIEGVPNAL